MVIQRVQRASVRVGGSVVSATGPGLCLLVGIAEGDGPEQVRTAVDKVAGLRIFADEEGKMNLSVRDTGGEVLVVSQFTLVGDMRRGRRPSFTQAARPDVAEPLISLMNELLAQHGIATQTGVFGAQMELDLVNDGPVTLVFDVESARQD